LQTPCSNHALNDLKPATPSPYTPPPDYTKAIEKGTQLAQSGGTLTSNPTSNRLWDSSTTPDYASYKIDVAYHTQNFTVHMPVSLDQSAGSSQATSVIGTLAPPLTKRQVIIEGKRKKGRPVLLKHVKYTDPDVGVCVPWGQAIIKQMVPTISVDGNFYEYSVQAEYWWACEKAFTGTAIGTALPWDAGAAQDDNHKVKLSDSDDARFTTPGTGGVA